MKRLKSKTALITGAASGIGAETAKLMSAEGAKVIVTDINEEQGKIIADEVQADFLPLDVSNESSWQNVAKSVGQIDVLFNNAGIIGFNEIGAQDPENISLDDWQFIHHVNLDGVFLGCKYGIKLMKKHGGSIINMSSRSGMVGVADTCAYASSKSAIRNHTKSVALYCASQDYNIRCNCVNPAAILTPLWEPMLGENREESIQTISAGIPLGCMGEPSDVANAVIYLAADESKYITGTEIVIDGGILAGSKSSPKKYNSK